MITPDGEFLELQALLAGRYSIERELGRGGMGIVFLARDVALDRPVAIKLLPGSLARVPAMRERFLREARTAAKLSHPNVVPIHLVEESGHLVFFVMGYVDGESLGQRVRRAGPLVPSEVQRIVREVAWALAYAHGQGVIHRDIKPDNILLERDTGRAMVTDFGIAQLAGGDGVTAAGELIGTAAYMSPEQAMGEAVDGRSDLYSLGVTAFYALTGRLPFEASNLPALLTQHVNVPAPRVASVGRTMPARLAEAVDRCLAKRPDDRFASGRELADALATAGEGRRPAPQVRVLLRQVQNAGVFFGAATAVFYVTAIYIEDLVPAVWRVILGLAPADRLAGALMLLVLVGQFPASLFKSTRKAVRDGLTHADVVSGLQAEGRALDEEKQVSGEPDRRRARRKNFVDRLIKWSWAAGLAGVATTVISVVNGDTIGALIAGPLIGMVGLAAWAAGPVVATDSPLRGLGLAERLMAGRFGKVLFRLAGLGLARPKRVAPAAGERTEVVLASAATDLFRQLEGGVRKQLPDVPDVIERLEGLAEALRKRERQLSDALAVAARDAPGGADREGSPAQRLGQERDRIRDRLASAVAALEGVRLDLLRLRAGVGTVDELTAVVERAREINAAVSAVLAGRDEVDRMLAAGEDATTGPGPAGGA